MTNNVKENLFEHIELEEGVPLMCDEGINGPRRQFNVTEEFFTKSHAAACQAVEAKYPGLGLKPNGAAMDVANFVTHITEEQALKHKIDWESLSEH